MENEEIKDEVIVDVDTISEETAIADEAPIEEVSPDVEAIEEEIIAE